MAWFGAWGDGMRAFKLCLIEGFEDEPKDMRVVICAAKDKQSAIDMYRNSEFRVVEVLDVTEWNGIELSVLRKILMEYSSPFDRLDNDSIELLISLVKQCYDKTYD